MQFSRERIKAILPEFKEVLEFNYAQTASHQSEFPLDVDWDLYLKMEDLGFVHVTTVRDNSKLVGYMSFMISPNLNFKRSKTAHTDKYVVLKDYWGQGLGKQLLTKTIEWAKELECKRLFGGVRINQGPVPLNMYKNLGFEEIETNLEKIL